MTVCPLCQTESSPILRLPQTRVWECGNGGCRMHFASPQLDDDQLREAYRLCYYAQQSSSPRYENTPDVIFRQILEFIGPRIGGLVGKDLLDYGSGKGVFCRLARESGMNVCAIEPDQGARQQAATQESLEVFPDLVHLGRSQPQRRFDLISLWDSIEHLRFPWHDLRALRPFLKSGGRVLVSTPNASSLRAYFLRARWENYINPTHFYYFTRTSLRAVLEAAGYSQVQEWRCPLHYPNHGRMRRATQRLLQRARLSGELLYVAKIQRSLGPDEDRRRRGLLTKAELQQSAAVSPVPSLKQFRRSI